MGCKDGPKVSRAFKAVAGGWNPGMLKLNYLKGDTRLVILYLDIQHSWAPNVTRAAHFSAWKNGLFEPRQSPSQAWTLTSLTPRVPSSMRGPNDFGSFGYYDIRCIQCNIYIYIHIIVYSVITFLWLSWPHPCAVALLLSGSLPITKITALSGLMKDRAMRVVRRLPRLKPAIVQKQSHIQWHPHENLIYPLVNKHK